jgi:hypothetical protein
MPMVNGMKFPYTEKGKKDAKMAAVKKTRSGGKKKQNWSGVKSQLSASSSY